MWKYREVPGKRINRLSNSRIRENILTGIAFPVKIVRGIAVTFQIKAGLFASWTMSKWDMVVCDFVEEVNFLLLEQNTSCNGVHRRISPSLVEETAVVVERVEKIKIGVGSQPFQATNFEI